MPAHDKPIDIVKITVVNCCKMCDFWRSGGKKKETLLPTTPIMLLYSWCRTFSPFNRHYTNSPTGLYTFGLVSVGRTCLNIKTICLWWPFLYFSWIMSEWFRTTYLCIWHNTIREKSDCLCTSLPIPPMQIIRDLRAAPTLPGLANPPLEGVRLAR